MVNPIFILDGAEIYESEISEILELVQIQYCKDFLGINYYVNDNIMLHWENVEGCLYVLIIM
jgi:predicted NACHT family NTPase